MGDLPCKVCSSSSSSSGLGGWAAGVRLLGGASLDFWGRLPRNRAVIITAMLSDISYQRQDPDVHRIIPIRQRQRKLLFKFNPIVSKTQSHDQCYAPCFFLLCLFSPWPRGKACCYELLTLAGSMALGSKTVVCLSLWIFSYLFANLSSGPQSQSSPSSLSFILARPGSR